MAKIVVGQKQRGDAEKIRVERDFLVELSEHFGLELGRAQFQSAGADAPTAGEVMAGLGELAVPDRIFNSIDCHIKIVVVRPGEGKNIERDTEFCFLGKE